MIFESILDSVKDSIVVTSLDVKVLYVNKAFTYNTGYSLDDLINSGLSVLQGPKTSARTISLMNEKLSSGAPFYGIAYQYKKDKSLYVQEWSISKFKRDQSDLYLSVQRVVDEDEVVNILDCSLDLEECSRSGDNGKIEEIIGRSLYFIDKINGEFFLPLHIVKKNLLGNLNDQINKIGFSSDNLKIKKIIREYELHAETLRQHEVFI